MVIKNQKNTSGFSLIEMLFAITILAIILVALLGSMLYTVNTLNEAKFRSNAIAKASSCLDKFKNARAEGWVQFNNKFNSINCNEFSGNVAATINGSAATEGGGTYYIQLDRDASARSGTNGHVKVSVQVCWDHFNNQINNTTPGGNCFSNKNRTATVEQIFYRYNDEQAI